MGYDKAKAVAEKVQLVTKVDPVVKDLYDYAKYIVDVDATMVRFIGLFYADVGRDARVVDRAVAREIIEARADSYERYEK